MGGTASIFECVLSCNQHSFVSVPCMVVTSNCNKNRHTPANVQKALVPATVTISLTTFCCDLTHAITQSENNTHNINEASSRCL